MGHGLVDESTKVTCAGVYRVGNRIYHCHAKTGHGTIGLEEAIAKSCNVFFYDLGLKLGIDKLYAEANRFHLNEKTGIELPFETSRIVVPSKQWKKRKLEKIGRQETRQIPL